MRRIKSLLLVALGSALFSLPSFAGQATVEEAASGKSVFSCGDSDVVPSFTEERSGEGKFRKMLFGNQRDDIPDFQQIKMLPSLTMVQRREFKDKLEMSRDQMQQLVAQLKELRPKVEGRQSADRPGGAGMVDQDARAKAMQLRTQIQELRKKSWEEIKPLLTQAQLQELAAMRKGQLQPATFHEPKSGGGMQ